MRNLIFAIIILAIAFFNYVYPLNILAHLLFEAKLVEPLSIIPTLIVALIVFAYFRTHSTSPLLKGFCYYGMGMGFLGFFIFNLGLIASLAIPEFTFEIGLICLVVFVFVCVRSLQNGQSIHVKKIQITSPKIKDHLNLIFISDVHLGSNPRQHLERICREIQGLEYDYLLIGGDLFDSTSFVAQDLTPLKAIEKPILFVTGNHEYYVRSHEDKLADLTNYNMTVLNNESVQFDRLNIIGVSDNQSPKTQSEIARGLVIQDAFNLLLVHQPSIWETIPENTDLMLSGHTHNGQIFPFNFLVRLQFKTVYGLYKRLNSTLYVSSGSGTWGPRMRLGTKNEIVQISLSP